MKYEHAIDDLIEEQLRYNDQPIHFTKIYDKVSETFATISKTTVQRHLNKMADVKINLVTKSKTSISGHGWHNETYYSLSDKSKSELRYYGDIQAIKSNREARSSEIEQEEKENEFIVQNKIYLLLLLQAAGGSARNFEEEKDEPGYFPMQDRSNRTKKVACRLGYQYGVTPNDIIRNRDVINGGILKDTEISPTTAKKCFNILRDVGLHDSIRQNKRTDHGVTECGIEIHDPQLKRLIGYIGCLISGIEDNIRYNWFYKRRPSKKGAWDLRWYTSFYGRDMTNRVLMQADARRARIRKEKYKRKKLELIKDGKRLLRLGGRGVVGIYHCEIICDKYEYPLHDEKRRHVYEKYREFVREVINNGNHKYSHLIHNLIDLVYPKSLRRLHEADPYLTKYVSNLPNKPLNQWTNIPVI
jgi:hypothetical protein